MYQAVIWDFGGVFTSSPFEAFERYEREKGLPVGVIRKINSTDPLENAWARFERAELDLESFDIAFTSEARALGYDIRGKDVIALLSGEFRPEMITALDKIRPHYKTGCITNNVPTSLAGFGQSKVLYSSEIMDRFDHVIESSRLGIRKPNPRIYEMMCEALSIEPEACIYLDDLGVNLKPAKAMGMTTIKVESGAQAIAALEATLGMSLA